MKKVSLTGSVFLLLSIIVFASFAASCGGGGGGVSAARGGNNAGKGGIIGGGSSASEEEAAKASSAKFSEGIMSLDWTTMDFKLWVNGQLYFSQTLNKGDTFAISGLKLGDHVKATGTFTTSDGTQEISGEIPSVQNGSKLSLYVTYKWECTVPASLPVGVTVSGTQSGTYTAEKGAILPVISQCRDGRTVKGWVDNNGKSFINIPAGTTGNLSLTIKDPESFNDDALFSLSNVDNSVMSELTDYAKTLKEIVIPAGITEINQAFMNNITITNVTIPGSISTIAAYAFRGCSSLKNVTISDGVSNISAECFDGCSSLETIYLPASIGYISYGAFYGCSSLRTVYFAGTRAQWNSISISSSNDCLTGATVICSDD